VLDEPVGADSHFVQWMMFRGKEGCPDSSVAERMLTIPDRVGERVQGQIDIMVKLF
jgi:hypothetical protein